nr:FGGY family carbohydrate kinase [Mangrovicoccus ximenensis]
MYLGIDLGTSGARLLLTDGDQRVIGSAEAPCNVAHPHPGWSEQDPQGWIDAIRAALAELRTDHGGVLAALKGIGFSGHMHGAVLLGADRQVLRPCILWNDTRSHLEAAALDAMPVMREASANVVFPGFTAPKLAWVRNHEPGIFAELVTVLLPKDYLLWWMTGRLVTDMSDAAGTSWLDVAGRRWSEAALEATGMRPDQMPDLVEGSEVVGTLRPGLAAELGLPAGVQVVAGGAQPGDLGALHDAAERRDTLRQHRADPAGRQRPALPLDQDRRLEVLRHRRLDGLQPLRSDQLQLGAQFGTDLEAQGLEAGLVGVAEGMDVVAVGNQPALARRFQVAAVELDRRRAERAHRGGAAAEPGLGAVGEEAEAPGRHPRPEFRPDPQRLPRVREHSGQRLPEARRGMRRDREGRDHPGIAVGGRLPRFVAVDQPDLLPPREKRERRADADGARADDDGLAHVRPPRGGRDAPPAGTGPPARR